MAKEFHIALQSSAQNFKFNFEFSEFRFERVKTELMSKTTNAARWFMVVCLVYKCRAKRHFFITKAYVFFYIFCYNFWLNVINNKLYKMYDVLLTLKALSFGNFLHEGNSYQSVGHNNTKQMLSCRCSRVCGSFRFISVYRTKSPQCFQGICSMH